MLTAVIQSTNCNQ